MTGWLLDTNILSELRRRKPEPKVLAFVAAQPLEQLYVSAVTLAEVRFGIELLPDVSRRAELNDWLTHKVRPMFEQRTLAVLDAGLRAGDSPPRALRAARLLQAYELLFWDALAEGIT